MRCFLARAKTAETETFPGRPAPPQLDTHLLSAISSVSPEPSRGWRGTFGGTLPVNVIHCPFPFAWYNWLLLQRNGGEYADSTGRAPTKSVHTDYSGMKFWRTLGKLSR